MLYVVSTPIGNLSDITFRAVETLRDCDYVLCEDTRHSLHLLNHYEIKKPLFSYHQFNERSKIALLMRDLHQGKRIALISDAGTPLISDPGFTLIEACIQENIPFTALPGPSALIDALVCSGLSPIPFQFLGFLPQKKTECAKALTQILHYNGTSICYESPHRLLETIEQLKLLDPDRKAVIAKELTKKFERFQRGTLSELHQQLSQEPIKGEFVFLVEGSESRLHEIYPDPLAYANQLEKQFNISKKDAIKIAAELTGKNKRELYTKSHLTLQDLSE
jgi:16S rRNA (cytidine1402-2'-O)-methyltransferase